MSDSEKSGFFFFKLKKNTATHLAEDMKGPFRPSSVFCMELRAAAALVSFPSHMDRARGTICPLLFASMVPKQLHNLFNRLPPRYVGAVWIKMQPDRISDEIGMKGAALFPEKIF